MGRALPTIPGARGRIGVIQPAPGLMLEAEWTSVMSAGIAFPVTRVPLYGGTEEDYAAMNGRAPDAAATLANAQADVIAYACGVGSLYRGPAAEAALCVTLSQAAGGRPVIGMAAASRSAFAVWGARSIAFITPYSDAVNDLLARYLQAAGLTIAASARFDVPNAIEAAGLSPESVERSVLKLAAETPHAELIWLPCSNVPTFAQIAALEERTKIPVISSNLALLWAALGAIGCRDRPVDSRLFEEGGDAQAAAAT